MVRTRFALPVALAGVVAVGVMTAGSASAGGSVTCSLTQSASAAVTAVSMPAPVRAGSTVSAVVTVTRVTGSTAPVEVTLAPSSWTRTNACVVVPAGQTRARFDVAVSPVTTDGRYATVGAYAAPGGVDQQLATSLIVRR